jgi:hypothetical protein
MDHIKITLYKNSQYAGENLADCYTGQWSLAPYAGDGLFCQGETTAQQDFALPPEYAYSKDKKGTPRIRFIKDDSEEDAWVIITNKDGEPYVAPPGTDPKAPIQFSRPPLIPWETYVEEMASRSRKTAATTDREGQRVPEPKNSLYGYIPQEIDYADGSRGFELW